MTNEEWSNVVHFKKEEFVQPDKIRANVVYALDDIRENFGQPIIITSSLRDAKHNADVGGVQNSAHLLAPDRMYSGIDFYPKGGMTDYNKYKIMEAIVLITHVCRIGIYKSHFHIDMEERLTQNVLWVSDTA